MGRISNIVIRFVNNTNTFQPGQLVTGHVELQLNKPTKIFSVSIKLHGECKTKWYTGSDKEKTYKEKEVYSSQELILWGGVRNQFVKLPKGNATKEFFFQLPDNCPSSFISKHGSIFYHVQVACKASGYSHTLDVPKAFMVYDVVELSPSELCYYPAQLKAQAHDECCCCNKIDAKIDITIDKSAYSPGDKVIVNGYIDNGSNRQLPFTIILRQNVTCYGRRADFSLMSSGNLKSKEKLNDVAIWEGVPVGPRSRKNFSNQETMTIPTLVASNLRYCKFISVAYFITIRSTMQSAMGNTELVAKPVDIVIGHRGLPDYSTLDQLEPSAPPGFDLAVPDYEEDEQYPSDPPPDFEAALELDDQHSPPPTYQEAIQKVDTIPSTSL